MFIIFSSILLFTCLYYQHKYSKSLLMDNLCNLLAFVLLSLLHCPSVMADNLDTITENAKYWARYCKEIDHGIDWDNPVARRWVHWSEWQNLITTTALDYINHLPRVDNTNKINLDALAPIWGLIMSDACIKNYRGNSGFCLNLMSKQSSAAYCAVTACLLEKIGLGYGIIRSTKNADSVQLTVTSKCHPHWTKLRQEWYPNNTKSIPKNLYELTTPFSLALAIMGDGGAHPFGIRLHLENFKESEVHRLKQTLFDKFNIECTVNPGPHLYVRTESLPVIRNLILPYMHKSWHYKVFNQKAKKL